MTTPQPTKAQRVARDICDRARNRTETQPGIETVIAIGDDLGPTLCRLTGQGRKFIGFSCDLTGRVYCIHIEE